jgi:hypothetical protein
VAREADRATSLLSESNIDQMPTLHGLRSSAFSALLQCPTRREDCPSSPSKPVGKGTYSRWPLSTSSGCHSIAHGGAMVGRVP